MCLFFCIKNLVVETAAVVRVHHYYDDYHRTLSEKHSKFLFNLQKATFSFNKPDVACNVQFVRKTSSKHSKSKGTTAV